jgi:HlyD family secretion protein
VTRPVPDRPPVRCTVLAGVAALALGFGGFGAWAARAPLAGAVVASGVIAVDGSRKTVQHLEGGIIAELLVREGDRVEAGQVLVRLDDLEARALHDLLEGEYFALRAQEARLEAERDGNEAIVFPAGLDWAPAEILAGQQRIFESGREALAGRIDVLGRRIAQLEAQAAAIEAQRAAGRDQLSLIAEEVGGVRTLVEKGLERRPRLLALERHAAALTGQQGDYANRIAQVREAIAETELEILNARRERVEKAALELREAGMRRAEVQERLTAASVALGRRDVVAPQSGVVLSLRYHTLGGVVPPGGEILDLVPEDGPLVVEVRVFPTDIDTVHPGQPARVALSAYKGRTTPYLDGRVLRVSADALADERTGQHFFRAEIEVDAGQVAVLDTVRLMPGMPVEAFIETGERTLLDYLIQPFTDSFRRAFREQ